MNNSDTNDKQPKHSNAFYWLIWIVALFGLLIVTGTLSLCIGSSGIPLAKILNLILGENKNTAEYSIIFDVRLPRILLASAIGSALSLSGVILQGMFRNPLVEPYTLGISGGAALGVCFNIVFQLHQKFGVLSMPISGLIGAILVILLVYSISVKKGMLKIQGLLLTGVMISFISSSLIMLIMAVSHIENLEGIIFWIMGSLEEPNWFLIKIGIIVSIAGLIISYLFASSLNAFFTGEEGALHLGINTERTKKILFLITSLLTGCAVSLVGIIGFVGLVVPHFVRMTVGYDHRILLAASFLTGGIFLIICDTIARTIIAPYELPVGVVTGLVGGTMFIIALYRKEHN